MSYQTHQLRVALDRAKGRATFARRQLDQASDELDPSDEHDARTLRKLNGDLEKAERDCAYAAWALTCAEAERESFFKRGA